MAGVSCVPGKFTNMRCPTLVLKSKLAMFALGVGEALLLLLVVVGAEVTEVGEVKLAGVVIVGWVVV
jgi:hypothetical protein